MRRNMLLLLVLMGLVLLFQGIGAAVPTDAAAEIPEEEEPWEEEPRKYVALTFDDGPKRPTTEKLLDGLKERGASATFFLIGEQVEENRDLVLRMAREGHQIGNHTWSHQRLDNTEPGTAAWEIGKTETALTELLGTGDYWLRPPYGQVSPGEEQRIAVPMVKWSVDPRDWESRDAEKVTRAILENTKPNSIILLHDIYPSSVDAALRVVDELQAEGYWFVTVRELLEINGVTPQPGTMYRTGTG